jgi:hypothetical protein
MQIRIRSQEDFWAGALFVVIGAAAAYLSRDYPIGSAMRMGPGYFPVVLSGLMILLGALLSLRALYVAGEGIGPWAWRPLLVLGSAFAAFGTLMDSAGFVPALLILIAGSALAGREFKLGEVLVLSAILTTLAVGIFVYGINLPYRLFWWS